MKSYIHVVLLLFFLQPPQSMASLGSIGKALLKSMGDKIVIINSSEKPALDVVKRISGLQQAAREMGNNFPDSQRKKIAQELENIVLKELQRQGYSQSVALACPSCIPKNLADDLGGRMIGILEDYQELLAKALLEPKHVTLLDASGKSITSIADQKKAFALVLKKYHQVFKDADASTWDTYTNSIKQGIAKSKFEAVIDVNKKSLSITVSSGILKGKLINVDLSKLYDKTKLYLSGGGIAALGYTVGGSNSGNNNKAYDLKSATKAMKRENALKNLNSRERKKLRRSANSKYIKDLYQNYKNTQQQKGTSKN